MNGSGYSQRRSNAANNYVVGGNAGYFASGSGGAGSTGATGGISSNLSFSIAGSNGSPGSAANSTANYFLSSAGRRNSRHAGALPHSSSANISAGAVDGSMQTGATSGGGLLSDTSGQASSLDINDTSGWSGYSSAYQPSNLPLPPPAAPQTFYSGQGANLSTSQSTPGGATGSIGSAGFGSSHSTNHNHNHSHTHASHSHSHGSHASHSHSGHGHASYSGHHHHGSTGGNSTNSLGITSTGGAANSSTYGSSDTGYFSNNPQQHMVTRSAASTGTAAHHVGSLSNTASTYGSSASLTAVDDFGFGSPGNLSSSAAGYSSYSDHLGGGIGSSYHNSASNKRKKPSYGKEPKRELYEEDRMTDVGDEKKPKQRATKACDKCREQKCKCVPDAQHPSTCAQCFLLGVSCTYRGPSHKRGPPKGYLSAVISRLEAMEDVILHKLSRNTDDPQARALLRELIGDVALGQVLSGRLKFGDRIDASGGGDGISFSPSASSVKKGSGPNGTTWQDTWWVSTPGVPTSHPRPSANRSLASRFPTTNVSVGTAMDLTPPVNAGNFPPPAFTSGDNPSTGFQSGDVSPKSIGRTATSVAVIGSSGQWQQPQQADAQNHRQSPAEPIRQGDALTPSLTALRVAEYGSDLASFWRGIADAQRAPAVGDKNLLEISLVVHDGTGSAAGKSTRLYRDGHNELARLTHAMEAMQTTETGSDAGRMRSPLPSERPVIQRGVCHVTVKVSEKHLDIAAGDQGSDALDDVAIARYFASDHHWNFPVVHYRYYRAMQARHEHGEKVIGFKDAYAAMALAAGTESTTESALCLEQSEKISLLRVAAALVHGYRALRLAHLVEAASYSSLAACWAQQLGLHRWHVVTDNPTNEEDDDQRHASQLLWSGCVVLDQLLKTTGITTTLTIDRAFSEMPPLLPSSTDSLRAVFDPSVDFDTALNSVVGLAGLHSLAVILSHTEQYAREIARRPVNGVQETLSALDRRLSRWSSMVEHTLDIVFEDCHGFAIGQSSAAMSTSREALAITTALVEQHAKLNINARLPPPFARMSVPQKVVTAIADQASSFANSRPAAVTRALSHPWSLTAMFAGGVEILISMQNGAKSDQVDAVKEDLDVVRNTLQAQRESCELACFYDDILTSVQGPKNASSQAEPAVSLPSEGDSDDGSGQGHDRGAAGSSSRGPSSTNGNGFGGLYSSDSQHGLNTSYHRTHNSNSSNNPFCQSASFSSTTNPSSDINSTPIASGTSFTSRLRGQAPTLEPASSSSVVRSSSPRAPSPETPTPIPADHSPYGWRANSSSNLRSRMDVELEGQLQRHGREVADQARSRVAVDGRQPTSLGYAPMKQAANGSEHGFLDTAVASIAHLNGLFSRSTRSSARSSPSAHRRQESPRDYFAPQRPLSSSHTPFGGDRTGAVFGSGGHGHNSGGVPTGASSLTEADFRPHTAAGNNSPDILSLSDRRDVSSGRFFAPSNNSRVPAALSGSPTSLTNLTAAPLVSSPSIQRAVTIANAGLQAQFATQNTSLRLSPTIARSSTSPTAPLQIFAAVAAGAAAFPTPGATLPRSSDDRDEGDHGSMMETGPIATADKEQLAIDTSTMMDTDTSMDGEGLPEDVDTTTHTSVLPTSSTLEDALGIANTTATLKSESQTRVETEQASSAISSTPSPSSTDTAVTATTTVNYTGTSAAEAAAAAVPTAVTSLAPSTTASLDLPIDSQLILKVESTPQVLPL